MEYNQLNLQSFIACPKCDKLQKTDALEYGKCSRCHFRLISSKPYSSDRVLALAIASLIIILNTLWLPFLSTSNAGIERQTTLLDVISTASEGWYFLLSLGVLLFVVLLPIIRALLLIYTIVPLQHGLKTLPFAKLAFRASEKLAPWAMTEIFILGTIVALVKITGVADVTYGISFWLFCVLVLVIVFQDAAICRYSLWQSIKRAKS